MMLTVARNNPVAVRRNLEPHNSYAAQLTPKGITESLFVLHQKNEDAAWTAVDVPWITGQDILIDAFVLNHAGQGSSLIRAKYNFKLHPHVITTTTEQIQAELPDPEMEWAVIFAFIMALSVIFVWIKTDK